MLKRIKKRQGKRVAEHNKKKKRMKKVGRRNKLVAKVLQQGLIQPDQQGVMGP